MRTVILVAAVVACTTPPPVSAPAPCGQDGPLGAPAQLTTAVHAAAGADIDPPLACDRRGSERGAFIRVHGHGHRPIQMGRAALEACTEPPATAEGCVFADAIGKAMIARLANRGVTASGLGLGVCGDINGDYDGWRVSISVTDWKDVDAAIAAVDDELRARDAAGSFGVSVRGISCSVPDLANR